MNIIEKTTEFSRDFEFTVTKDRQEMLQLAISFLNEEVGEIAEAIFYENRK